MENRYFITDVYIPSARPEDTEEPQEARRILTLQDYQDEDLCDDLRDRGYTGEITKTKTIKI